MGKLRKIIKDGFPTWAMNLIVGNGGQSEILMSDKGFLVIKSAVDHNNQYNSCGYVSSPHSRCTTTV